MSHELAREDRRCSPRRQRSGPSKIGADALDSPMSNRSTPSSNLDSELPQDSVGDKTERYRRCESRVLERRARRHSRAGKQPLAGAIIPNNVSGWSSWREQQFVKSLTFTLGYISLREKSEKSAIQTLVFSILKRVLLTAGLCSHVGSLKS